VHYQLPITGAFKVPIDMVDAFVEELLKEQKKIDKVVEDKQITATLQ